MKTFSRRLLSSLFLALAPFALQAQTLRVGLAEDPDVLDPTLARTFVGRIVFAALCDKLFDVDEKLNIVPQLATGYEWSADSKALTIKLRPGVTFHDGEKLDAAAVKFNLERHKTMPGSNRSGELRPVASVDVVDPATVRLNLSAPFSPLLAALADRAGMMVSPKAAQAAGQNFGVKPVCSGPFKFVERVAQDRMVFERYAEYWDKDKIHFDKVIYTPVPDATVRLANLRAGQFDFIERVAPSDIEKLKSDAKLKVARITEIGYQGITINVGKSEIAQKHALGKDARVREAFELAIDRQGIVQVAMDNEATVGNQWVAPNNPYYAKNVPIPKRDVARARALLKEAGIEKPSVTLITPTTSDAQRIALIVQAMVRDAGFDVKIQSTEFATSLNMADKGDFEAYVLAWSGRADPDGNLYSFDACKQPLNYAGYCVPGDRRAAEPVAHAARPGRAQEGLRADRGARAEGPADHLPVPPQLAVGLHREARRRAQHPGRPAARQRPEDELTRRRRAALRRRRDVRVPGPSHRDDPADLAVRVDADLRAAAAAARRSGGDPRRRGARPERRRLPAREAPPRRAAAGALPALGRRRAAGRSRRVGAQPAAGARADRAEAAGDGRARAARDDDRAGDRHPGRRRLGGRPRHRVGLRGQRVRAVGPVDAELLARHPDDPAVLGAARLAAGFGLRQPVRGPAREPRGDDHAGVRARQRDRRGADAPHAQRDAAGAVGRLRAHRAREGPQRDASSC